MCWVEFTDALSSGPLYELTLGVHINGAASGRCNEPQDGG